jgi:hypothetical protein
VLSGTLGAIRCVPGVDRFSLRAGRATEAVAYFDTRPLVAANADATAG